MQRLIEINRVGDATLAVAIAQHIRREAGDHHLGGGQRRIGISGVLARSTEVTLASAFINERATHDALQVEIKLAIGLRDLRWSGGGTRGRHVIRAAQINFAVVRQETPSCEFKVLNIRAPVTVGITNGNPKATGGRGNQCGCWEHDVWVVRRQVIGRGNRAVAGDVVGGAVQVKVHAALQIGRTNAQGITSEARVRHTSRLQAVIHHRPKARRQHLVACAGNGGHHASVVEQQLCPTARRERGAQSPRGPCAPVLNANIVRVKEARGLLT